MPSSIAFNQASKLLKGYALPPQPTIITAIRTVAPDLGKMSDVIEHDPAIAAAVLKVINSPVIGLAKPVTSIKHAVTLLGLNSVMNIVNAVSLKRALGLNVGTQQLNNFWRATNDVASAMTTIVRQLNLQNSGITVDEAYCVGLFHHCGMPAMITKFENYFTMLPQAYCLENEALTDLENRHYHTNHAVLGYYITKSWHLPTNLSAVIQIHHNPFVFAHQESLSEPVRLLFSVLKLAEYTVGESRIFGENSSNFEWDKLREGILGYLGVSDLDFEELKDIVLDVIENEDNS